MKRVFVLGVSIALAGASIAACSSDPPLPEYYGLYLRAGHTLVDLQRAGAIELGTGSESETVLNGGASENVEVLLFAKEVTSPLFSPDKLRLARVGWIRSRTEHVHDEPGGQVLHTLLTSRAGTAERYEVGLRARPVEGQPEMVILTPAQPLVPGIYRFGIDTSESLWARISNQAGGPVFSIGLPPSFTAAHPAVCSDEHYQTTRSRGFNWDDFGNLVTGRLRQIDGRNVFRASVEPCDVLDRDLAEWEAQVESLVENGDLQSAAALTETILQARPASPAATLVFDGFRDLAERAVAAGRWDEAVSAGKRARDFNSDDEIAGLVELAESRRSAEEAADRRARLDEQQALLSAALRANREGWLYGENSTRRDSWPFRLKLNEFDPAGGTLSGVMDYYTSEDGATPYAISGRVVDGELVVVRPPSSGESDPLELRLHLADDERLSGQYKVMPDGATGNSELDLNVARNEERTKKLLDAARLSRLRQLSREPTTEILQFWSRPVFARDELVVLTDVGLKKHYQYPYDPPGKLTDSEEDIFFDELSESDYVSLQQDDVDDWLIVLKGEWRSFFGGTNTTKEYAACERAACDDLVEAIRAAVEAWRAKFPELHMRR